MNFDEFVKSVRASIAEEGSQKAYAERLGISQAYLTDVLKKRRTPGEKFLKAAGYKKIISYEVEK